MAWLGVPFTGSGWDGSLLAKASFWQQFIDQANAKLGAAHDWTTAGTFFSPTAGITVALGDTIGGGGSVDLDLTLLREVKRAYAAAFGFVPSVGDLEDTIFAVGNSTREQGLLDRINAILTDNGCDPMGTTMQADRDGVYLGLPFTRKWGRPDAPNLGYGRPQNGDILGPWIFNEWWALLETFTHLVTGSMLGASSSAGLYPLLEEELRAGNGFGSSGAAALSAASSSYAAGSYSPPFTFTAREAVWQTIIDDSGLPPPDDYQATLYASRMSLRVRSPKLVDVLNLDYLTLPAIVAHVAAPVSVSTPLPISFEPFGSGLESGKVGFIDTHAAWSGTDGVLETLPKVSVSTPPDTPQVPDNTVQGYRLSPAALFPLNIPPPT